MSLKFTLLTARAVSQFDIDKEHVDVNKINTKLCKTEVKVKYLL
jgi:predicted RNA methylase